MIIPGDQVALRCLLIRSMAVAGATAAADALKAATEAIQQLQQQVASQSQAHAAAIEAEKQQMMQQMEEQKKAHEEAMLAQKQAHEEEKARKEKEAQDKRDRRASVIRRRWLSVRTSVRELTMRRKAAVQIQCLYRSRDARQRIKYACIIAHHPSAPFTRI